MAVLGSTGQLGAEVCGELERAGVRVERLDHAGVDVADGDAVHRALRRAKPDAVVNTAAMHNVEQCEQDPARAFQVNGIGARNVARASGEIDAYLIHVSTDYVFDGRQREPYLEQDRPGPLNVYGNTKLSGEAFVAAAWERSLVMRVSGLYGRHPCRAKGLNFVDLMLHLAAERNEVRVVDNEFVSPTSTRQVAKQVLRLLRDPVYGLCHGTAEGGCSWHEFAAAIFRLAGVSTRLSVADPAEFPMKTPRPLYSILENGVLKARGTNEFGSWEEGLAEYLKESRQA